MEKSPLIILHQILVEQFNESELRTLCSHLGLDLDALFNGNKEDKSWELIAFLNRHHRLAELIHIGKQFRPDVTWDAWDKALAVATHKQEANIDASQLTERLASLPEKEQKDTDTLKIPSFQLITAPIGIMRITAGSMYGMMYFLTEEIREVIVGRSSKATNFVAEILVNDLAVARRHFRINIVPIEGSVTSGRGYRFTLTDFASANGTFLNGQQVSGTVELHHGDKIQTGGTTFSLWLLNQA